MDSHGNSGGMRQLPGEMHDLDAPLADIEAPFRCALTVGWGDCDPAQIAYTARIPEWVLEAIEHWYRDCLGLGWYEINLDRGIGTPFVSLNFDFHSPVTPRHPLNMTVYIKKLGRSSISHSVQGRQDEKLCFSATTTAVFTDASAMQPIPVPPNIRSTIETFISRQGPED